jgi:GNAT superfamily N-acetyltransferase
MPNDPLVRRARPDEGLQVASVWLAARRAAFPAIPAPVHSDADVRRWFVEEVLPAQEVWVAEVDGCIVGLLVVDAGWVTQLYVDPLRQRRGLGSALLERAQERAPDGLDLWTFETNAGSHRFYERHGFVLGESTDGRGNEEQAPDRRYRWSRAERPS